MHPTPQIPSDAELFAAAKRCGAAADAMAAQNAQLIKAHAHDPKFRTALRVSLPHLTDAEFAALLEGQVNTPAVTTAALLAGSHEPAAN